MKTQVFEGSNQEIVQQVTRIHGRIVKAVLYVDEANGTTTATAGPAKPLTEAQFEKLLTEAQSDTVAVGHFDDSREAIYTRVDGE